MISGVQTLPARVRPAVTGRRAGLALILLLGAVGIPLAYSLIPGQHAVDTPASESALTVPGHTQSSEAAAQASVSALTTGRAEEDIRSNFPAPAAATPESLGVGSAQSLQQHRPGHTSSAAGNAPSTDRVAQSSSQADTADAKMASNDSVLGGAALEPLAPMAMADEVLHITNVGDKIVVTRGADGPRATATPERSAGYPGSTTTYGSNEPAGGNQDTAGSVEQRPDYEDVYPGCPRVLPQGADEKMALERQQLYGCLYYESCANPEDNEPPYCTWHLIKKL